MIEEKDRTPTEKSAMLKTEARDSCREIFGMVLEPLFLAEYRPFCPVSEISKKKGSKDETH